MSDSGRPHPAKKALNVWSSRVKPSSTETGIISPLKRQAQSHRPGLQTKFLPASTAEGRVFRRLLDSYNLLRDPVEKVLYPGLRDHKHRHHTNTTHTGRNQSERGVAQETITVPTCCTFHKDQVCEEVHHHRRYLYNSPPPVLPQLTANSSYDRTERLTNVNLSRNDRRQLPLSTVVVRWRNSGRVRAYDTETLYDLLSSFGPVTAIYTTSLNAAYVVFSDLADACQVIEVRSLGRADNKLYCHWLHQNMANKLFYLSAGGLRVYHDEFIQESH